jgi:hypothetical protein
VSRKWSDWAAGPNVPLENAINNFRIVVGAASLPVIYLHKKNPDSKDPVSGNRGRSALISREQMKK